MLCSHCNHLRELYIQITIQVGYSNVIVVGLDCCRGNFRLRIVVVGKESVPTVRIANTVARYECWSSRRVKMSEDYYLFS